MVNGRGIRHLNLSVASGEWLLHRAKLPLSAGPQDWRSMTGGEGLSAIAPTGGELRLPTP